MGIRFECPNGHRLNVKEFLAGQRGICPDCDVRFIVPNVSGGRVVAVVDTVADAISPVVAAVSAPPALEMNGPLPRTTLRPVRLDQRVKRAKLATMSLGVLAVILIAVMAVILLR